VDAKKIIRILQALLNALRHNSQALELLLPIAATVGVPQAILEQLDMQSNTTHSAALEHSEFKSPAVPPRSPITSFSEMLPKQHRAKSPLTNQPPISPYRAPSATISPPKDSKASTRTRKRPSNPNTDKKHPATAAAAAAAAKKPITRTHSAETRALQQYWQAVDDFECEISCSPEDAITPAFSNMSISKFKPRQSTSTTAAATTTTTTTTSAATSVPSSMSTQPFGSLPNAIDNDDSGSDTDTDTESHKASAAVFAPTAPESAEPPASRATTRAKKVIECMCCTMIATLCCTSGTSLRLLVLSFPVPQKRPGKVIHEEPPAKRNKITSPITSKQPSSSSSSSLKSKPVRMYLSSHSYMLSF
jgi:hypothetical protein